MGVSIDHSGRLRLPEARSLLRPNTRCSMTAAPDPVYPDRATVILTADDDLPHTRPHRLALSLTASQLRILGDEIREAALLIDGERSLFVRLSWAAAGLLLAIGIVAQVLR